MNFEEQLAAVFDRGVRNGIDSLSRSERDLYLIQDFIIEYEMNGLTGYFYNRLPNLDMINETVAAMKGHGLFEISDLLSAAADLFHQYVDLSTSTTWSDALQQLDPSDRLHELSDRIRSLGNYGLNGAV